MSELEDLSIELAVMRARNRLLDEALREAEATVERQMLELGVLRKVIQALAPQLIHRKRLTAAANAKRSRDTDALARQAKALRAKDLKYREIAVAMQRDDLSLPDIQTVGRWVRKKRSTKQ